MNKELKNKETELAKRYDHRCHYIKDGIRYGANVLLKEPFSYGENVDPEELEFMDTDEMKVYGFYTYQDAIILTDGVGECDLDDFLSDNEARQFLSYISDENNLEFEH